MKVNRPRCDLKKSVKGILTFFFFFKQKTAYEMTCDWSSDVCSSDLGYPRFPTPWSSHLPRGGASVRCAAGACKPPRGAVAALAANLTLQFRGHALVGLAERDALRDHQAVGLLGGVNRGIEPDGLAAELQRPDGRRQYGEGRERQVDAAEQRELQQLQVAVVAGGELRAHAEGLGEARLRAGGAAAEELEHVRVAFLRHDRGAGREAFGQRDEAELEGGEQQHVGGEAPEILQQQRDLEQQLRFGLAARELYRGDGLLHGGESQAAAGGITVDGEPGRAVARRRAQRALVDAAAHPGEAGRVVAQLRRKTSGPQRHRARHGLLLVGVARERGVLLARGELIERLGYLERAAGERRDGFAQVQADRGEHLVVARAPEVNARAGVADAPGQAPLECRLAVLVGGLDAPGTARVLLRQRGEARADGDEILVREQTLGVQHRGVRDRGAHVVRHQAFIERAVLARGVMQHPLIERRALVPQPRHGVLCCSAGVSAFTSATISVPVPSLVNTSPRIPSGDWYDTTCTRRTPPRMASSMAFALGSMPAAMWPSSRRRFSPLRSV